MEIQGSDYARDTISVNGGYEADVLNAQGLAADRIRLVLRGGPSSDTLTGSLGDDVFAWFPGDGNEAIDGRMGNDTLQVNGSAANQMFAITTNGFRLRFTRDIASVVLDVDAVERFTLAAQGGTDTIALADLSGTAVRQVGLDLGSPTDKTGDGQPDTLSVNAVTASAIATSLGPGTMAITWAGVRFSVTGVEPANDRLILQTPAGAAPAMISAVGQESAVGRGAFDDRTFHDVARFEQ